MKFFKNLKSIHLSYPEMYFGIAGTIWSLRNPKNVIFLGSNDVNSRNPPCLPTCVIYEYEKYENVKIFKLSR